MRITPESLTEAAINIGKLGEQVRDNAVVPLLNAERAVTSLHDSAVAGALAGADNASRQAKNTLASRHAALAELLYSTASSFQGQDQALADELRGFGDLNDKAGPP